MKREVVETFLNLPGIAGIALMDGRSRPYFHGVDQELNFQQKETLAQGIQQIIQTTPLGFEFFEYQFSGRQVFIYKLKQGIILLVLAAPDVLSDQYLTVVGELKNEFYEDTANAIATFRLVAGTLTVNGQNFRKQASEPLIEALPQPAASPSKAPGASTSTPITAPIPIAVPTPSKTVPASDAKPTSPPAVPVKDVLAALNHFSQFTTQYLGATVVTNYWKSTRPDIDWLSQFQVDRSAQISVPDSAASLSLTPEQHQWVRDWTAVFIQRCSKVIRDYPTIIKQRALDDHQKALLLSE